MKKKKIEPAIDETPAAVLAEIRASCGAFGAAREGAHIAGYVQGRVVSNVRWLLEEGRWALAGLSDAGALVDAIRLEAYRLSEQERKAIEGAVKTADATVSNRRIAAMLGVSRMTVNRDIGTSVPNNAENANESNDAENVGGTNVPPALSGEEAAALVAKAERKLAAAAETKARREASRSAEPLPDGMELRIGDCRTVLTDVPDNSVPLVLTDLPYGDEAEPLYRWLAEFSAAKLIPGGSLICYTGQSRLDRDMAIFSAKLRYWWLLAMMHDQSQRLPGKFVIANFKPVLWYVKDHRRGRTLMPDILKSPKREKGDHPWGQGEGGVGQIIEHLTEPGELIIDPFAGTATWGRIAASMGRRWLGADIAEGGTATVQAAE